MGVVSIGGLTALNSKLENDAVSARVSRLSTVIEAAYECYVAGEAPKGCKAAASDDQLSLGGWSPDVDYNSKLSAYTPTELGVGRYADYSASPGQVENERIRHLQVMVEIVDDVIGKRVAREVGGEYINGEVVVPVGVPGTEMAITSAVGRAVERTRTGDFEADDFLLEREDKENEGQFFRKNIVGAGDVDSQTVTIDGVKIDRTLASSLATVSAMNCRSNQMVAFNGGKFSCQNIPEPVTCSINGRIVSVGQQGSSWSSCTPSSRYSGYGHNCSCGSRTVSTSRGLGYRYLITSTCGVTGHVDRTSSGASGCRTSVSYRSCRRCGGGGTCIPGWTLILMASGEWKQIKDIQVGESIQGRTQVNVVQAYDRIILRNHRTAKLFEINGAYQNTDDHLTLLDSGWSVLNKDNYGKYNNQMLDCVYDENLISTPTLFKGFPEGKVSVYGIGDNIATGFNNEYRKIESISEVAGVDLDQTIYSLVADGDGTMIVNGGYVLSAWADEDKWKS